MPALPPGASDYDPGDGFDEAFAGPGCRARATTWTSSSRSARSGRGGRRPGSRRGIAAEAVTFGGEERRRRSWSTRCPRLLTAEAEWKELTTGLRQRVLALDAFVADVHGPRRAIADGVVPAARRRGLRLPGGRAARPRSRSAARASRSRASTSCATATVASRCSRTTSAPRRAARTAWRRRRRSRRRCRPTSRTRPRPSGCTTALRHCMEATNPDVEGELVLLTDGPGNSAWYEHKRLAEVADLRLVAARRAAAPRRAARAASTARPSARSTAAPTRTACATSDGQLTYLAELLLERAALGDDRPRELVRQRGRGRQARLPLRRRPRPAATSARSRDLTLGPDLRPRRRDGPGRRARPPRRARAQAARRARRGRA